MKYTIMSKEQASKLSSEIAGNIVKQQNAPAYQVVEASYTALAAAIASYDATLAATNAVTSNKDLAKVSTFTSVVTSSATSAVNTTTIENTIVSKTSLLLMQKYLALDQSILKTFNYYWDKYPDLYQRIQVLFTDVDENGNQIMDYSKIIENNIKYLNEYYNKGYRLFIGFDISNVLAGVLPWFENTGLEAQGISPSSTADSLNIIKPVYRLEVGKNRILKYLLSSFLNDASKIYYVYSEGGLTPEGTLLYLKINYPDKLIPYPVKPDSSNLTLSNIKELYKDADEKSLTIQLIYINTQQSDFVNLFNDSYPMPTITYDLYTSIKPIINESSKNALVNKYKPLDNISFSTSQLYRDGLYTLKNNFFPSVPNSLLLINCICLQQNINSLPSDNSILEFNEDNDVKYFTSLILVYSKDDKGNYYYKEDFYSVYDPIVGEQIFYVNN